MCGHHYAKLMGLLRKHVEGTHKKQKTLGLNWWWYFLPLHPLTKDNASIDWTTQTKPATKYTIVKISTFALVLFWLASALNDHQHDLIIINPCLTGTTQKNTHPTQLIRRTVSKVGRIYGRIAKLMGTDQIKFTTCYSDNDGVRVQHPVVVLFHDPCRHRSSVTSQFALPQHRKYI